MSGQMIERGENKFLLRVYLGRNAAGKRQYASKMFHGGPVAARKELATMAHLAGNETLQRPSEQTFEAFVEDWYGWKLNVTEATLKDYKKKIGRYLLPIFGPIKLHKITPLLVQTTIKSWVSKGLSPRTISYLLSLLHAVCEKAVELGFLVRNPTAHTSAPSKASKELDILTASEAAHLLRSSHDSKDYPLWLLLLTTGLRPGEALGLRWQDLQDDMLTVNRTLVNGSVIEDSAKTKKSLRTIPLSAETMNMLRNHRGLGIGYIFPNATGEPMSLSAVRARWKVALAHAGLPSKYRLYSTRHAHATMLLNKHVNLKAISNRLGHSSTAITEAVYARVMPQLQREAAIDVIRQVAKT